MNSQKKSSTKVRAKKTAPTGQRQFSNLLRSQKAALVKDNMKPSRVLATAPVSRQTQIRSEGKNFPLCRTGPKSELLFSIPASTTSNFTVVKRLRINPLSRDVFKWLPQIAQNFESYKFHKLHLRYENRCSTSTAGSIIMSPSYDAADSDAQAATEQLLYENKGTQDGSVWKNQVLALAPSAMNRLYKSHTCMSDERYATTKQDQKTIDAAQVFICLDGVPSTSITGKVFLDYDCEFFEPHAPTEPVNQGGIHAESGALNYTSNVPLTGDMTTTRQDFSPVLKLVNDLVTEGVISGFPTAVAGKFLRDYKGIVSLETVGTGITGLPRLWKGSATAAAGTGDDVLLPNLTVTGPGMSSSTRTIVNLLVDAIAGEYLKFDTSTQTSSNSGNGYALHMGGSAAL